MENRSAGFSKLPGVRVHELMVAELEIGNGISEDPGCSSGIEIAHFLFPELAVEPTELFGLTWTVVA